MLNDKEKFLILIAIYTYKNLEQAEGKKEYDKLYDKLMKEWDK